MSLWTPDGERRVPPASEGGGAASPIDDGPELSPEEEERARELAQELAEARVRLLETEVSTVLANHAAGIYELAAIHLAVEKPKLDEARLAVDALATLVEGLEGRLGEGEPTLRDALHQLRMAFVQRTRETQQSGAQEVPEA
ncbi:MAG: DUF1844 domain-containing protein [Actinomycetota bacterium]